MRKENYISSESGAIFIGTVIVGLLALYAVVYIGTLAVDDYYGSKYERIEKEKQKEALPKRLQYIEEHPELDEWVRKKIKAGYGWRGFTEEQVRIAENTWGEPEVKEGSDLPLGADKMLIFHEAAGFKDYYYFKNNKVIYVHPYARKLPVFSKEEEKEILQRK